MIAQTIAAFVKSPWLYGSFIKVETVDSLVHLLTSSGGLAGSAAAALLIGLLVQRARSRRSTQAQADDSSLNPC